MKRSTLALLLIMLAGPASAAETTAADDYLPKSLLAPSMPCPFPFAVKGESALEPAINPFEAEWYAEAWRSVGEPSLYTASLSPLGQTARSYRFTWIRSFHGTIIVRLDEGSDGGMRMTASIPSFDPASPKNRIERMLAGREVAQVRRALRKTAVLRAPPALCPLIGSDGAQWIFDANDAGTYRFAHRWSPDTGPVREIGLVLLRLTGWPLDPIY